MPPRVITTETQIVFVIDAEFGGQINNENTGIGVAIEEIGYITTGKQKLIPSFVLESGMLSFTGSVTPTADPQDDLGNWRFGVAQNVTTYYKEASYGPLGGAATYTVRENFQYPAPLRDGEVAEVPFSYNEIALTLNQQASLSDSNNEDNPRWIIPQEIVGNVPALRTSGTVSLASWMMLARVTDPKQIILLGLLEWSVNLAATNVAGVLQYGAPGEVMTIDQTYQLSITYEAQSLPPDLGDGYIVPDLRMGVSANDYRQGALYQGHAEVRRFKYDDEDAAVAWTQLDPPGTYANWIDIQQASPKAEHGLT